MAFRRLLHVTVVIERIGSFSLFCISRNMKVSDWFETDMLTIVHAIVAQCQPAVIYPNVVVVFRTLANYYVISAQLTRQ